MNIAVSGMGMNAATLAVPAVVTPLNAGSAGKSRLVRPEQGSRMKGY